MITRCTPRTEPLLEEAAEARILASRATRMRLLIADAKDLARIQESRHYAARRCGTLRDFGERILTLSSRETTETAAIGTALRVFPELEVMLLDARTTPEAAAALGPLCARQLAEREAWEPDPIRPEDLWLLWAEKESAKAVRRRVQRRLRELGHEGERRRVSLDLTPEACVDLDRVRQVASPKEHEPVGPSEAVAVALRYYLRKNDPLERRAGTRRMPDTRLTRERHALVPECGWTRSVPAEVERKVIQRAEGKCRIPFCDSDLFLEKVHVHEKHSAGGSREAVNLDLHCRAHHRLQENGRIRNIGTTDEPKFVDDHGVPLDVRWLVWLRSRDPPA